MNKKILLLAFISNILFSCNESEKGEEAKEKLMKEFEFSDAQAEHILMMRLQSLVGLELNKILDEIDEKKKLIE